MHGTFLEMNINACWYDLLIVNSSRYFRCGVFLYQVPSAKPNGGRVPAATTIGGIFWEVFGMRIRFNTLQ